jgi:hypothetical protein
LTFATTGFRDGFPAGGVDTCSDGAAAGAGGLATGGFSVFTGLAVPGLCAASALFGCPMAVIFLRTTVGFCELFAESSQLVKRKMMQAKLINKR